MVRVRGRVGTGPTVLVVVLGTCTQSSHGFSVGATTRMSLTDSRPVSRRAAVGIWAAWAAGLATVPYPALALDPVQRSQEMWRMWQQEEADARLGGELASPGGAKTMSPVTTLVPVVKLRSQLEGLGAMLEDPQRWSEALSTLGDPSFETREVKRVFNAYSDNIYFSPDSGRANKYLDGGASPTSMQTTQYLLRNDILTHVQDLAAEVAFLVRERERGQGGDNDAPDAGEARGILAAARESFDRYLALSNPEDLAEATRVAKAAIRQ